MTQEGPAYRRDRSAVDRPRNDDIRFVILISGDTHPAVRKARLKMIRRGFSRNRLRGRASPRPRQFRFHPRQRVLHAASAADEPLRTALRGPPTLPLQISQRKSAIARSPPRYIYLAREAAHKICVDYTTRKNGRQHRGIDSGGIRNDICPAFVRIDCTDCLDGRRMKP